MVPPMKIIKLTLGHEALVDDGDYAELSKHFWHALIVKRGDRRHVYARKRIRTPYGTYANKRIGMHVFLMNPPAGLVVDHIDGNTLNNQRANLRCVTRSRNMSNSLFKPPHGYPGVYKKRNNYWWSEIIVDGHRKRLGRFSTAEDAAKAYRDAYLSAFGEEHRFYRNTGTA
jgi:hypothetical protein